MYSNVKSNEVMMNPTMVVQGCSIPLGRAINL